jgi:hypothetical protein
VAFRAHRLLSRWVHPGYWMSRETERPTLAFKCQGGGRACKRGRPWHRFYLWHLPHRQMGFCPSNRSECSHGVAWHSAAACRRLISRRFIQDTGGLVSSTGSSIGARRLKYRKGRPWHAGASVLWAHLTFLSYVNGTKFHAPQMAAWGRHIAHCIISSVGPANVASPAT